MTTIIAPNPDPTVTGTDTPSGTRRSLVARGLAAGAGAAVTTSIVAATARGLAVSLKVSGFGASSPQPIPIAGFASVTLFGVLLDRPDERTGLLRRSRAGVGHSAGSKIIL